MNFSPNAYHLLPANSGGDGISKSLRAEAKWVCWHSQVVTAAQWWEASLSWIIGCAACNTQSPFGSSICRTLFSLSFFFLLLFAGRLSQAARRISRIYALRMVVESTCPSTRNKVKPIVLAVTTAERFAMKFKVAAICLLLGLSTVLAQDSCEIGTCVVIRQCPQLLKILTTFPRDDAGLDKLRSRNCGYEKRYPRVCCTPEEMIDADQKLNINTNSNNNQNNNNNNQNDNDNNNNQNNNRLIVVTPPSVSSGDYESAKKLLPSDCGRDLSNRIVGGNITGLDEFPWMALLEYRKPTGKATACGGVLISHRYVLTAAHCVKTGALPKSWSLVGVRLGEYNTATDRDCIPDGDEDTICADDPISVGIEEQIVHENYGANSVNQHYDIALLRLSRDVPFTNYIKPICLPIGPNISNKLVVAGWGKTEYRSESEVKLKVSLPLVSNSECSKRYQRQMIESQLCAGGEQGKDSCRGDSGGPIMQQSRRPEDRSLRWEAAGVVSFGPSPCGMQGWPGVYTNVYYYVPWILSKLRP